MVLILEKARIGEDIGQSYTPSFGLLFKRVAPIQRSLIRKKMVRIQLKHCWNTKFFSMPGTQRTLFKKIEHWEFGARWN